MDDNSPKNAAREDGVAGPLDMDPVPVIAETDIDPHVGFTDVEEFESQVILERHERHRVRDRAHVDLTQEEYTPEEVARLIGTSLDVVMHAIWERDLKAERKGHHVTCIKHEDVTDWLRRRLAQ
ncbi:MAG: helix-turn-helix domain-containing protein [Chloroflexia bacterium]